ncbi:MAG: methyltransferase domain-containing protein [Dehalococcoidia bacterium]|nr:methyltransferase domain-containing protein [Dehalococcoidia bacterium]
MIPDTRADSAHHRIDRSLFDLPFDHFERHALTRAVVDLVREHSGRPALRVLDVGGAAASLARFLPEDDVLAIDPEDSAGQGYMRGVGTQLPFRDGAFDVVTCHDTLEHVPADCREAFIREMVRVASRFVIVNGPFLDPRVEAAEALVMQVARDTLGDSSATVRFLNEHLYHGLPPLEETRRQMGEGGLRSIVVPSGALDRWLANMLMKHHLSVLAGHEVQAHAFDRWSNSAYQPVAEPEPTYRHAILMSRTGDSRLMELLAKKLNAPAERPHAEEGAIGLPFEVASRAVSRFSRLAEEQLERKDALIERLEARLREVDATVARLQDTLADKDAILGEQEDLLAEREVALDDVAQQLDAIRWSFGYRVLEAQRRALRWLFPPGSWRGMPYRAVRRAVRLAARAPRRFVSLSRKAMRARQRYGTPALVGKSIGHLAGRAHGAIDPVKYALSVDWQPGATRQPAALPALNLDHPTVNWVIPTFGEGGGLRTIFRFVAFLEGHGFRQRIYEMPVGRPARRSREELRSLIRRSFGLSLRDVFLDFEEMEPSDITFATSWHTAYPVLKFEATRKKCYFVQDFEPFFAPVGTESALTENTYRFGFHGVTAGRWLCDKLSADYGMTCDYFDLAVDRRVYFPKDMGPRRKLFFYARPATPRRGFELGVKALEIFHSRNRGYQIVVAGGDVGGDPFPFPATNAGYVSEDKLNDLYNQSAAALVISLTNCSLLPLEIMATGCPVVTTIGDNNEKVLPPDSAILAVPSPQHLAQALEDAVKRPARKELIAAAERYSWEEQGEKVAALLKRLLADLPA